MKNVVSIQLERNISGVFSLAPPHSIPKPGFVSLPRTPYHQKAYCILYMGLTPP